MVTIKKEALISAIVAERALGGTHCSNCGHCKATL